MNRVFITSFSSISSLGIGLKESLKNLQTQKQLIQIPGENDKFNKPYFAINPSLKLNNKKILCSQFALTLLDLIKDSWIQVSPISLFLSTSTGGIKETEDVYEEVKKNNIKYPVFKRHFFNTIFNDIKEEYGNSILDSFTLSVACSSSGHGIMQAYKMIKNGVIDKALIIGVDVLCLTTMVGFDSLKLVSTIGTKPLTKQRDGLSLGDGGGILLLESNPHIDPVAEVIGVHSNSDGYHISSPDPNGTQQFECVTRSIKDANIQPEEIDYINAHGTGTIMNDEVELKVISSIFPEVVVTSTKAFIGHTLGASAITELPLVLEMLKNDVIYQPIDLGEPINEKYIPRESISKKVKYFLKNSFGFGGNNVSIVIKNLF